MIDPKLVYGPTAERCARALFQSEAYLILEDPTPERFYEWKSGVLAPVYCDCRRIQGHPGPFRTLVKALCSSIEANFPQGEVIVGMADAGIQWSSTVAMELGWRQGYVRKMAKAHGTGRMVEGNLGPDDRVILVDDLMGSGGTALEAILKVEDETGAHVVGVQTIVNWDFQAMRRGFRTIGVPYRALVSFPQILKVAVDLGLITPEASVELSSFYRNPKPKDHVFNLDAFRRTEQYGERTDGVA
jgi:orotate phosphoribosyltransferase